MKLRRILFFIALTGFFCVGLYTDERLYYIIFFAMFFMVMVSALSMLWTLLKFSYVQTLTPENSVKGDQVRLSIQIHNDFILPFPHIQIYYDTLETYLNGEIKSATLSIMPRKNAVVEELIECKYRGDYPVGLKKAEISDVFGLLSITLDFSKIYYFKTIHLLVRPRILITPRLPLPHKAVEGKTMQLQRTNEHTANMADIRQYQIEDTLKHIHWKLSARLNQLMVKNFEQSTLPDTALYLDCADHRLEGIDGVALEDNLLECTTAVAYHALSKWRPLKMVSWTSSRMEMHGNTPQDFTSMYDYLSNLQFGGSYKMEDILVNELRSVSYSGCLFLVTWRLSNDTFDILMLLRKSGVDITVILIGAHHQELRSDLMISERMILQLREVGIHVVWMRSDENFAKVLEAGV